MMIWKDKTMVVVILTVCAGIMPQLFFKNGFLLAYLSKMNIKSSDVMILLALPSVMMFFLSMPFAYYSDRYGKKKIGVSGITMTSVGFAFLIGSGYLNDKAAYFCVVIGFLVFSIGVSALLAGWFALLSPIVPKEIRGSFFGSLRVSWQVFAIGCSFIITYILGKNSSLLSYQLILVFFTILMIGQIFLYSRIPELEKNIKESKSIKKIFSDIIKIPGYMPFCSYCFLLMLATGSWPVTMGLLEKDVLHFSDDLIVQMGTMLFLGSMAGFYFGGKLVDRVGTKMVFLTVHFSYCFFLFMVIIRDVVQIPYSWYFGFLTGILGLIQASSSIALTSEMMALAPQENKSLTLSFCLSLQVGGAAISGVFSGKIIEFGVFSETWSILGLSLSNYDTLILFYSAMVFVFIVTLGLIPSVVKINKVQWVPHTSKTL